VGSVVTCSWIRVIGDVVAGRAMLYAAARAHYRGQVIRPALEEGGSSCATYLALLWLPGFRAGAGHDDIIMLNVWAPNACSPI
jgi:hypothetical protein